MDKVGVEVCGQGTQHNAVMMQFHVSDKECKIPDQWKLSVETNLKSKALSFPGHALVNITVHYMECFQDSHLS